MSTAAARTQNLRSTRPVLYLAFELGWRQWRLAFSLGMAIRPRLRSLRARDLDGLDQEIGRHGPPHPRSARPAHPTEAKASSLPPRRARLSYGPAQRDLVR